MCYDLSPTQGTSLCSCQCAILMHCINNLIHEQLLPELKRFNMYLCVSLSGLGLYNICQIFVQRRTLMLKAVFKKFSQISLLSPMRQKVLACPWCLRFEPSFSLQTKSKSVLPELWGWAVCSCLALYKRLGP